MEKGGAHTSTIDANCPAENCHATTTRSEGPMKRDGQERDAAETRYNNASFRYILHYFFHPFMVSSVVGRPTGFERNSAADWREHHRTCRGAA